MSQTIVWFVFYLSERSNAATYTYLAHSPIVQNTSFQQSSTARIITMRSHENRNRLTSVGGTKAAAVGLALPAPWASDRAHARLHAGRKSPWPTKVGEEKVKNGTQNEPCYGLV